MAVDSGQESLSRLAWRRMLRHHAAMACMILVLVVTLLSYGADLFAPHDPTETRTWLRVLPPGSSAPATIAENRFRLGEAPETDALLTAAQRIELESVEWIDAVDYRITPRAGRIAMIQEQVGQRFLQQVDLSGLLVHPIVGEGDIGPGQEGLALAVGDAIPEQLDPGPGRSLMLRAVDPTRIKEHHFVIELADGLVQGIERDGDTSLQQLRLPAQAVISAKADGAEASRFFLFGTDAEGRDLFSRVLYGGRISLTVGLVATAVSMLIGVLYGAVSGWLGGRSDRLMMGAIDVLYAIPFMFLVIVLLVFFGRNAIVLFAALGAVQWLTTARIVRGQVLSLKHRAFIEAAKLSGAGNMRILLRHLIPNCLGPIIVYSTLTVPAVILEESFLAFIGLQVEWGGQALDSWGALVREGADVMDLYPWRLLVPALLMSATLLAMNVVGDALRDAIDPQLRERR